MLNLTILFVDDEEIMTAIGKKMLERFGHQVTCSTDSLNALSIFRKTPEKFDIVFTDYNMPVMKGNELALMLRGIRSDIPVILSTGDSGIRKKHIRNWPVDDLIHKPFQPVEIQAILVKIFCCAMKKPC